LLLWPCGGCSGGTHTLFINNVNKQQDATTFSFINLFNSVLHVSGDKFAHPQEHVLTIHSFWYNAPTLLPTDATVEMNYSQKELLMKGEFVARNM
jgi:hypothetical protein